MQICTVLTWIVRGCELGNIWVIAMAGMAWGFVRGMVRWHRRHDLMRRFPAGWPEYRACVDEWRPRWRPSVPVAGDLHYDPAWRLQGLLWRWMDARETGLRIVRSVGSARDTGGDHRAQGAKAWAWALGHVTL